MGFFRTINKAKDFLNKSADKIGGFSNKVISGVDKGIHIAGKVVSIADKAAGALENVPVIGEVAGLARPFLKQGMNLLNGADNGLNKINKVNNKFGKVRLR